MKKSILIGVLAALMLFAFTACENNSSAIGLVDRIVAVQNETYVAGETPDASGFTFTGYTTYGDEVALDSADVTLKAAGSNGYDIFYQGEKCGSVVVDFEELKELKVDASASKAVYYEVLSGKTLVSGEALPTSRDIDTTGIVVTAEYDGGSKVIANDALTFTNSTWTKGEQTVTVKLGSETEEGEYKINVLENLVSSVAMAASDDYVLFSDVADKDALAYATDGDTAGVYMAVTYQGGEVVRVATDTDIQFATGTSGDKVTYGNLAAVNVDLEKASISLTAVYQGKDGVVGLNKTAAPLTVNIEKDSVIDITFALSTDNTNGEIVAADYTDLAPACDDTTSAVKAAFTVTPVWKSGKTATALTYLTKTLDEAGETTDYYTIDPVDLSDWTVGDRYTVTLNAVANGFEDSASIDVVAIASKN